MRNWLRSAAGASSLAILAGCAAGPQFVSLPENIAYNFKAIPVMEQARSLQPSGDAFQQGLYEGYMEHAEYEYGPLMMDFKDAIYHANKAIAAAQGNVPQPTQISERILPADKVDELTQARARLVAALAGPGKPAHPMEAGKAQAFFDCWMEQQEENFQPKDIEYCRDGFFTNLEAIEQRPMTQQMPEMVTLSADVFFDFDKSTLKSQFVPELDKIADMLVADTTTNILVWGHTDTAGSKPYNQRLSERRAETVARYLAGKGVSRNRMSIQGFGETRLAVQTPDNTPNQQNRRVEIRRR